MHQEILKGLPDDIKLVAVSKTKAVSDIRRVYDVGQRIFGENRCEEMRKKFEELPKDIDWHMIGHLQSRQVKIIALFVKLIHSVDSLKLIHAANKEAAKHNRIIDCLLQIRIAKEETKTGLSIEEAEELLSCGDFKNLKNIRIIGVMGMATFTQDEDIVRGEFKQLKEYFESDDNFKEISAGMSGDYKIAINEGSTIIRIGSLIFGRRCVK